MRKIYITFGGSIYDSVTKRIVQDGQRLGADDVWVYDDLWLTQQNFYTQNKWLWNHPHKRGFGWYAWKPYVIIDALSRLDDGDIVLYTDADTYPVGDLNVLYDIANRDGVMLFEVSGAKKQSVWCKRDCFIVMGQDSERYHDAQPAVARFMLFKKGPWGPRQLLMEWLSYCINPLATTFDKSVLGKEIDGFIEHRAEQSILTNLAHKYGYRLYREADEAGKGSQKDRDIYQEIFSQRNPWNDSNGKTNVTAPVEGSKYKKIPDRAFLTALSRRPENTAHKKRVARLLSRWNRLKMSTSEKMKLLAFRYTPRSVKKFIKKKLEQ